MSQVIDDRQISRARLAVTITFLINGFCAGAFVARIPDFKKILDVSNGTLGASLLCVSIGVFLALRPAGRNSARFGSQPVIFVATIALSFSLPLVGALYGNSRCRDECSCSSS